MKKPNFQDVLNQWALMKGEFNIIKAMLIGIIIPLYTGMFFVVKVLIQSGGVIK